MNSVPSPYAFNPDKLVKLARKFVGQWVGLETHGWKSLYAWRTGKLYDSFGDTVGELESNTIYLSTLSLRPEEDLLHELGHLVARRFNLVGYRENGFHGSWEHRQSRLIACIRHDRHWSDLCSRISKECGDVNSSPGADLGSELWAELFMSWHLYPQRIERQYIEREMEFLAGEKELRAIRKLTDSIISQQSTRR